LQPNVLMKNQKEIYSLIKKLSSVKRKCHHS
jgi:hypothetical protein